MDKMDCRMCGKTRNSSNLIAINNELMHMIEYHCRISLDFTDTKYPNKMCFDCNHIIVNFTSFVDLVKQTQIKFSARFYQVKVEIEEFPLILELQNEKSTTLVNNQPKIEVFADCESNHLTKFNENDFEDYGDEEEQAEENDKESSYEKKENEESAYDEATTDSDSDYIENKYKKRKKKTATKQKRVRSKRIKINKDAADEISILKEIEEEDRYKNGGIKKKGLAAYEGKLWKDIKISCVECNQVIKGPFELRLHHFKYHTLDSEFKCFICPENDNMIMSYFYQYLNHSIEHQDFLRFCCIICSEMFWNTKSLNTHYETSHEKSDCTAIFHCLRCGQYFRKAFDLTNHESRIHNIEILHDEFESKSNLITMENLFKEEFAVEVVEQKAAFMLSDEFKHPDGSVTKECSEKFSKQLWNNIAVYQCSHCTAQCTTVYHLYEHYNTEHPGLKCNFLCSSCPDKKVFLNMESYINHAFTIHHEHLRYFCFICNSGYWNYKSMYEHYKLAHESYKAYICLYCGKYHKCGYDIRHHKEVHLQKIGKHDKNKTFSCNQCPKSFSRQSQLQRHIDTHLKNDGKVWICETCGRSFSAKSTLINHAMVHQTDKPFVCETCGEGFKNKYKLKHHKGIHTGERNFGCEICGQRFRAKGTLKGHMLTHTGERNFSCEFCDKRFAAKYDLMVHTRLHTGEFTHECPICHERYPSWSNYSKHMRGRHNVDPRSEKKKKYDALHKSGPSQSDMNVDSSSSSQYYQM